MLNLSNCIIIIIHNIIRNNHNNNFVRKVIYNLNKRSTGKRIRTAAIEGRVKGGSAGTVDERVGLISAFKILFTFPDFELFDRK